MPYMRVGRRYAWVTLAMAVLIFAVMERALITRDFTSAYVAEVGSSKTRAFFNFTSLWSSLEGSIILWTLILCGYVAVIARKFRESRHRPDGRVGVVGALRRHRVLLLPDGRSDEPVQDVRTRSRASTAPAPTRSCRITYSSPSTRRCCISATSASPCPSRLRFAALITGRVGEGWLLETRRWTLFAWGFLTLGILLGAWWSYEVLGWGGYWAWDPVENASFLPWLTGTAFLHSVMVQERRGMLRVWNLSLVVRDVLAHDPRHVPHSLGRCRVGARVQQLDHRPDPAHLLRRHRRVDHRARRVAWRRAAGARADRFAVVT